MGRPHLGRKKGTSWGGLERRDSRRSCAELRVPKPGPAPAGPSAACSGGQSAGVWGDPREAAAGQAGQTRGTRGSRGRGGAARRHIGGSDWR